MKNLKVKVSNEDEMYEAVKLLTILGYKPSKDFNYVIRFVQDDGYYGYYVCTSDKKLCEEITLPDLKEAVNRLLEQTDKEYLDPIGYCYHKCLECDSQPEWIEIPKDADYYVQFDRALDPAFIRMQNGRWFILDSSNTWIHCGFIIDIYRVDVLWSRNKMEETHDVLSSSEAKLAFATGKQLEIKRKDNSVWNSNISSYAIGLFDDPAWEFRIKVNTIKIGYSEIIAPVDIKLDYGQRFYIPSLRAPYYEVLTCNANMEDEYHGLVHFIKENAIAHGKALVALTAGSVE